MTIPDGIVLVDKPAGITSHGVVAALRRMFGVRKIGHGGTLDPGATGLLVVFVGRATRLAGYLGGGVKEYAATIRFGAATATDDADGDVVEVMPVPRASFEEMSESRTRFLGEIEQTPPAFSAVRVGGERAYRAARKGAPLDLAPRTVKIEAIDVARWEPPDLEVRVVCHGGTYIRSLARDWGRVLDTVAHVARLRRTRSVPFDVREALTLDEIEHRVAEGRVGSVVGSPVSPLVHALRRVCEISSDDAVRFGHGTTVRLSPSGGAVEPGDVAVVMAGNSFVGLADVRSSEDGLSIGLSPRLVWSPA